MNSVFAFFEGMFAPSHIIIVLVVGVVVFGKRLPEFGGYLGRAIVSFRNSVRGLEEDLHPPPLPQQASSPEGIRPPQRIPASVPKFENGNSPKPAQPEV
jgi:sec-independent protein translocase protein TatA